MQNTLPNLILASLQLGLGVQKHRQFGSKFLIESLYSDGFSLTYTEILPFERFAAAYQGTNIPDLVEHQNYSMQAVADNVDHNAKTMDGRNTFHSSCYTLPEINISSDTCHVDYDWTCIWLLNPAQTSLSGFMQMIQGGARHGLALILFMPIIDQKSADPVCILSIINFVCSLAKKYPMTPILTIDQPLYRKEMELRASFNRNLLREKCSYSEFYNCVLRLGGFQISMSFMGTIGHLMLGLEFGLCLSKFIQS